MAYQRGLCYVQELLSPGVATNSNSSYCATSVVAYIITVQYFRFLPIYHYARKILSDTPRMLNNILL